MRTRDAALIRKLCGLGLPPQFIVQSLLPALREIIPAHSGGVFWVGGDAQMTALYAERLLEPDAMAAYYERHYKDAVEGFAAAFRRRARDDDPVSSHSFSPAEQNTPYFREILSSLDAYHVLYGILNHDGAAYAQLSLYRGVADEPFDHDDRRALRGVLRYIADGLYDPGRNPLESEASLVAEESLGIVDSSGGIVSATDQWRRLVRLAALAHVSPSQASQEPEAIASFLRELSRSSPKRGLSTASYHVKQVYSKLEVNGRGEVQQQLLRLAGREFEASHVPR